MEKQKKVLNVIKGYMSKFDIEQVTIIEDDKESVIFSGDVEKFLHPCETMQNEACKGQKNDCEHGKGSSSQQ